MDNHSRRKNPSLLSRASAVDLQHLRYAIAAADHGSFRRAAEALVLRQSTLSRCIRQLEQTAGMVVFERSSGGVRTTSTGRDFIRAARSIVDQMDVLMASAYSTGRGDTGRLTIGFDTSLSVGNLRATLIEYARRFPEMDIGLIENSRARLAAKLRTGAIDLAVVIGEAAFPECRSMPLWSERILIVLPESHRLAADEIIYWTDLKGETLVLSQRDWGSEMQDLVIAKLISPEDRPKIVRHDISRESIKSLVAAGFGISLTLEASLGVNFAGVIHRDVRDGTGTNRVEYTAQWRGDSYNPALANFLRILEERYPLPGT